MSDGKHELDDVMCLLADYLEGQNAELDAQESREAKDLLLADLRRIVGPSGSALREAFEGVRAFLADYLGDQELQLHIPQDGKWKYLTFDDWYKAKRREI